MQVFIPTSSSANTVNGNFTVTGNTQLDRNLNVGGNETVDGNLNVLGTVSGGSVSYSNLVVSGNATVGGTLGVTGNTTLGNETVTGTLGVTGNTTLGGELMLNGIQGGTGTLVGLALNSTNQVVIGSSSGGGSVTAISTSDSNVIMTPDPIETTGTIALNPNPTFTSMTITGNETVGGTLGITGVTTLTATPVLSSNQITGSTATVTLPASAGTLALTSAIPSGIVTTTTLDNNSLPASFTSLAVSGNETVGGTLGVTGVTTLTATPVLSSNSITGSSATVSLPSTNGTLALVPASGSFVTTVTLDNGTLPASFTTLAVSSNETVGGTLGVTGVTTLTSTPVFSSNSITGSSATVALPSTNGTLALVPSSGSYVTTVTLDNDTLPASLTTLATSGLMSVNAGISLTGNIASSGNLNESIPNNSDVFSWLVSTTEMMRLDGFGDLITSGVVVIGRSNIPSATGGTVLNSQGTFNINLPAASGTLALAPTSGTVVTTTTLDNNTLPASVTTLNSSGNTQLGTSGGSSTTKTANSTLDDGLGNTTITGQLVVGQAPGTSNPMQLISSYNATTFTAAIQSEHVGVTFAPLQLNPSGGSVSTENNVLDNGSGAMTIVGPLSGSGSSLEIECGAATLTFSNSVGSITTNNGNIIDDGIGNAKFVGLTLTAIGAIIGHSTVTIGNNSVLTSGGAASLTLPASSGTIALAPNYFIASSSSGSGLLTTWTSYGSRGVTNSTTTFTCPAGNYHIAYSGTFSVPANTVAELSLAFSGVTGSSNDTTAQYTNPVAGSTGNYTITGSGNVTSSSSFTLTLAQSGGITVVNAVNIQIQQLI